MAAMRHEGGKLWNQLPKSVDVVCCEWNLSDIQGMIEVGPKRMILKYRFWIHNGILIHFLNGS